MGNQTQRNNHQKTNNVSQKFKLGLSLFFLGLLGVFDYANYNNTS